MFTTEEKRSFIHSLSEQINECTKCHFDKKRKKNIIGMGKIDSKIMIIGESQSINENKEWLPFCDNIKVFLIRMLKYSGIKSNSLYITSLIKCRLPNKRKPSEKEIQFCYPFLKHQLDIIAPLLIITLGECSTKSITKINKKITKIIKEDRIIIINKYPSKIVVPMFHPSYLIRNKNIMKQHFDDLRKRLIIAVKKIN